VDISSLLIKNRTHAILNGEATWLQSEKLKIENAKTLLDKQQVRFIENRGQMADAEGNPVPFVLFKARSSGLDLYVTEKGLTYVFLKEDLLKEHDTKEKKFEFNKHERTKLEMAWINVELKGASIKRENIIKKGSSTHFNQYFLAHCPDGITGVRGYDMVIVKDVYPGIDWVLYNSNERGFKYDFVINKGANPSQIEMIYESENLLELNKNGGITIKTAIGELDEHAPFSYLEASHKEIESSFSRKQIDKHHCGITFTIKERPNESFIIDPQLVWSTVVGGSMDDSFNGVKKDYLGNYYVIGYSTSTNYPIQNLPGGFNQSSLFQQQDLVILKFNNLMAMVWSTYYGGNGVEYCYDLAVDHNNDLIVIGNTNSNPFPVQAFPGGYNQLTYTLGNTDIFILKFNALGVRVWATYYGGNQDDEPLSVDVDSFNNIFIAGHTSSFIFPLQNLAGSYNQSTNGGGWTDGFILKFNSSCVRLWATYYGGNDSERMYVKVDQNDNVFVSGETASLNFPLLNLPGAYFQATHAGGTLDAFIIKFNSSLVRLWSTFYGGIGGDENHGIAFDGNNNLCLAGRTTGNFPLVYLSGAYNQSVSAGITDAYISKFDNNYSVMWASLYGGNDNEYNLSIGNSLAIDSCNRIYLHLITQSTVAPTKYLNYSFNDTIYNGGLSDALLLSFGENCSLRWGTYFGGDGNDEFRGMTTDGRNGIIAVGESWGTPTSATYSFVNPGGGAFFDNTYSGPSDGFIVRLSGVQPSYIQAQTNPSTCPCDGVASLSVVAGEAPFTYLWSNNIIQANVSSSVSTLNGLCPGVYQVTVSSSCNYSYTTSFTLTGSVANLTANIAVSNATTCYTPTGSVLFNSITNGSPTYTVLENSNVLANNVNTPFAIGNVGVGTHTFAVFASNGCTLSVFNVSLAAILPTINTISAGTLTCIQSTLLLQGNSTPSNPTYTWLPQNINSNSVQVNSPGVYTLNVMDLNNGCTSSNTVSVIQNTIVPNLTAVPSNSLTCIQFSVTLQGNSTTPNVTYTWQPQNVNTSTVIVNSAGVCTLQITDPVNGCTNFTTAAIAQNTVIPSLTVSSSGSLSCSQTVAVLSGSSSASSASYTWIPQNAFSNTVSVSSAGVYTLNITDLINGCTNSKTLTVFQNTTSPNVSATVSGTLTCSQLTVLVQGNSITSNTTYTWFPQNVNTSIAPVVAPGNYTFSVTDISNGCNTSTVVQVFQTQPPTLSISSQTNVSCNVGNDGAVAIQILGGTGPFQYSWNTVPTQTTSSAIGLSVGPYTLTVTDFHNCVATVTVQVSQPSATQPSISINTNTMISTASATYQWYLNGNPISGATQQTYAFIQNGFYKVCITDVNSCVACSDSIQILNLGLLNGNEPLNFLIYPNPNKGDFMVNLSGYPRKLELVLINSLGQVVFSQTLNNGANRITRKDLTNGLYYCLIKADGEIVKTTKLEIDPD
jgi:hypothetical protein